MLTQIIFEQENKEGGQNLLPINFLRQLIRFYGDSMQNMVPRYLEVSMESLHARAGEVPPAAHPGVRHDAVRPLLEEQVRRNMEMFERAFAMFTPFARRERTKPAAAKRREAGALATRAISTNSSASSTEMRSKVEQAERRREVSRQ